MTESNNVTNTKSHSDHARGESVRQPEQVQSVSTAIKDGREAGTQVGTPAHRRSGIMNLINFMTKYNLNRTDQKRQAITDLSQTVSAADIARIEEQIRSQNRNMTKDFFLAFMKKIRYLLAFCVWIFLGSVFYSLHDDMGWSLGIYQSLSIGFSLGWNLPPGAIAEHRSTSRIIISKLFTFFHNFIGVLFSGLAVIYIANDLLHRQKNWILQSDVRKKIDATSKSNWFLGNIIAFGTHHLPKIRVFIVFFFVATLGTLWCFISFKHRPEWDFPSACVFSFSTLSSAGYRAIPDSSEPYQFVICAIYAAVGIPLMTISLGLFIGRIFFNHEDVTLFEQMAADVTPKEMETMRLFCDKGEESQIDNLEFAILIALRIGAVAPEMIQQIKCRFDMLDRNHQHRLAYEDILVGGGGKSDRVGLDRTNNFLTSSFNLRQLVTSKAKMKSLSSRIASEHSLLSNGSNEYDSTTSNNNTLGMNTKNKNKVYPDSPVGRPRGLSFESNGISLSRLRSFSGDGNFDYVRTRVRTESGDEIFNAWVKSSPKIDRSQLHKQSIVSEGSDEGSEETNDEEQLLAAANDFKSGVVTRKRARTDATRGRHRASSEATHGRHRASSDANDGCPPLPSDFSPRRSLRESFTVSEEESLQLSRRDSGRKWVRNSSQNNPRKQSVVLSEDEAVKFTAMQDEDIVWIKSSPMQTRLQDSEVLAEEDIRHFSNKESDIKPAEQIVARRLPSRNRRASISLELNPLRPTSIEEIRNNNKHIINANNGNNIREDKISEGKGEEEGGSETNEMGTNSVDLEAGHRQQSVYQSRRGTTRSSNRIVRQKRATFMDVATGAISFKSFVKQKTRKSQRLGFLERNEQNNIMKMEKARLHHQRSLSSRNSLTEGMWFYLSVVFYDPHVQFLVLWLTWLFCGAVIFMITYKTKGDENYVMRGFYETVNVGYGLYLTTPEFKEAGYSFTTIHLMFGSVMISGAMAEFARYLNKVNDNDNLKAIHVHRNELNSDNIMNKVGVEEEFLGEEHSTEGHNERLRQKWLDKKYICSFFLRSWQNYPFHFLFVSWLLIMTTTVSFRHHWTFFDSLCFSTSVLSTGGFIAMPQDSSTFDYFLIAMFATAGVPLMALSLGMFTHYISRLGEQSALVELINAGISPEELSEMEDLEIVDDDGHLDISEYIILILLRIGALKPDLIKLTNIRFDQLQDLQQNQSLEAENKVSVHALRRETVMNHVAEQKKFVKQASSLASS